MPSPSEVHQRSSRTSDVWVRLDPHLTRQATKSYVERECFWLILHKEFLLFVQALWNRLLRGTGSGRPDEQRDELAALH